MKLICTYDFKRIRQGGRPGDEQVGNGEGIFSSTLCLGSIVAHVCRRCFKIVDISHTSDKTASAVLSYSLAPPIFSHSNARAIHPVRRNVPDSILEQISRSNLPNSTVRSKDALVAITFAPQFVSDGGASLGKVADHIEYVAKLAGRDHVGLGSDFDGIGTVPVGLEVGLAFATFV